MWQSVSEAVGFERLASSRKDAVRSERAMRVSVVWPSKNKLLWINVRANEVRLLRKAVVKFINSLDELIYKLDRANIQVIEFRNHVYDYCRDINLLSIGKCKKQKRKSEKPKEIIIIIYGLLLLLLIMSIVKES